MTWILIVIGLLIVAFLATASMGNTHYAHTLFSEKRSEQGHRSAYRPAWHTLFLILFLATPVMATSYRVSGTLDPNVADIYYYYGLYGGYPEYRTANGVYCLWETRPGGQPYFHIASVSDRELGGAYKYWTQSIGQIVGSFYQPYNDATGTAMVAEYIVDSNDGCGPFFP